MGLGTAVKEKTNQFLERAFAKEELDIKIRNSI